MAEQEQQQQVTALSPQPPSPGRGGPRGRTPVWQGEGEQERVRPLDERSAGPSPRAYCCGSPPRTPQNRADRDSLPDSQSCASDHCFQSLGELTEEDAQRADKPLRLATRRLLAAEEEIARAKTAASQSPGSGDVRERRRRTRQSQSGMLTPRSAMRAQHDAPYGFVRHEDSARPSCTRPICGSLCAPAAGPSDIYVLRNGVIEQFPSDLLEKAAPLAPQDPAAAAVLVPAPGRVLAHMTWENSSTHADRRDRPQVRLSADGTRAEPAHRSVQGTATGQVAFSSGIHQWRVGARGLGGVTFGVVGRVGLDSFTQCRRGELPPYLACLRPGPLEHRLHWRDSEGRDRCLELSPPLRADGGQGSDSDDCGDSDEVDLAVVVDFLHRLVLFMVGHSVVAVVDCRRERAAADPRGVARLIAESPSAAQAYAGSPTGSTGAAAERASAADSSALLLGDHTVFCHVRSGSSVTLRRQVAPRFPPLTFADLEASAASAAGRILCGNPHVRWGQIDGEGLDAGFRLPLGLYHWENSLWVTDCDTVREVQLPEGRVVTHRVQPPDPSITVEFLGALVVHAPLTADGEPAAVPCIYAYDITNGIILQIAMGTWESKIVFNRGQHGFRPCSESRRRRLSLLLREMMVYDAAAAMSPAVASVIAQLCCETWRGTRSLDLHMHRFGVHGMAAVSSLGMFFIVDADRHCIFSCDIASVDPVQRNTPRIALGVPGRAGCRTGFGDEVRFRRPTGLVVDHDAEVLYVADTGNSRILKIAAQLSSNGVLVTQATMVNHVVPGETTELGEEVVWLQPHGLVMQAPFLLATEPCTSALWQVTLLQGARATGDSFLAPIEHLLALVRQAIRQADSMPVKNNEHLQVLRDALEILTITPNIYQIQYVGAPMDADMAKFLVEEYQQTPFCEDDSVYEGDTSGSDKGESEGDAKTAEPDDSGATPGTPRSRRTSESPTRRRSQRGSIYVQSVPCRFKDPQVLAAGGALGFDLPQLDELEFDVFRAVEACERDAMRSAAAQQGEGILLHVAYNVLSRYRFFQKYFPDQAGKQRLIQYIVLAQQGYHSKNPYHNHIHAADVVQTLHWMLNASGLISSLPDVDAFALLISAVIHDYDHVGLSNAFLVNTQHEFALEFNDQSPLEHHHTQHAFRLLQVDGCDILQNLSAEERKTFREAVVNHVLGTDMKHHFSMISDLKRKLEVCKGTGEEGGREPLLADPADKLLLLKAFLHMADISNPAKPHAVSVQWSQRVMREFRLQGIQEEAQGLPYSPFMDPQAEISACQRGFIEYVVRPLMELLAQYFTGLMPMLEYCDDNLQYWKDVKPTSPKQRKKKNTSPRARTSPQARERRRSSLKVPPSLKSPKSNRRRSSAVAAAPER
eukprot:TRINITY_DN1570_c0_g1_i1.p1 TRINITY_DN1570_c0_g1~~TRINITY_DN1570_c0_g1_i1.p1  ORF type:complete len:1374 (+),score=357.79 TRINITY_DN1570_c0_g1_i1:81-4202(+)